MTQRKGIILAGGSGSSSVGGMLLGLHYQLQQVRLISYERKTGPTGL